MGRYVDGGAAASGAAALIPTIITPQHTDFKTWPSADVSFYNSVTAFWTPYSKPVTPQFETLGQGEVNFLALGSNGVAGGVNIDIEIDGVLAYSSPSMVPPSTQNIASIIGAVYADGTGVAHSVSEGSVKFSSSFRVFVWATQQAYVYLYHKEQIA